MPASFEERGVPPLARAAASSSTVFDLARSRTPSPDFARAPAVASRRRISVVDLDAAPSGSASVGGAAPVSLGKCGGALSEVDRGVVQEQREVGKGGSDPDESSHSPGAALILYWYKYRTGGASRAVPQSQNSISVGPVYY